MESKMLKAKCKKTGQYFGLELREIEGKWLVVNMVRLSEDESKVIASEVKQSVFVTNKNLLPCLKCGSRIVGRCNCAKKKHSCSPSMKYQFDCIYCDELEIDYSRPRMRGPYTKWAGTSNIPDAIKDKYGNPQGSQFDLAEDGSFEGYTIVVLNLCRECNFAMPKVALEKKGFKIIEYTNAPNAFELKRVLSDDSSQLWVISDRNGHLNAEHIDIIKKYYESGHGVYIWGDNDPYYVDANLILTSLFGITMTGNSRGDNVLGIQTIGNKSGIIPNHPITTGIVSFYEGITIAEILAGQVLQPLMYGSNGKVVAAYYDKNGKRAIADGGFTRLYYKWDSAGTDRYVVNAAAWLANIEYFGYKN